MDAPYAKDCGSSDGGAGHGGPRLPSRSCRCRRESSRGGRAVRCPHHGPGATLVVGVTGPVDGGGPVEGTGPDRTPRYVHDTVTVNVTVTGVVGLPSTFSKFCTQLDMSTRPVTVPPT